jgi:hypothetical protein
MVSVHKQIFIIHLLIVCLIVQTDVALIDGGDQLPLPPLPIGYQQKMTGYT